MAEERSTTPVEASTPDLASEPLSRASGTDGVVYHGPPARSADCPFGAVASAPIVIESPALSPAPFVAVIVVDPSAVAPAVQP